MVLGLKVRFSLPDRFIVQFDDRETEPLPFQSPLVQTDRDDIRWYLETYGAAYTSEPDDLRAQAIEIKLPQWGTALFAAIFSNESALEAYHTFEATNTENKQLTIVSNHPEILSLPWELLCDGRGTPFLLRDPAIGIRRCLDRTLEEKDQRIQPKQRLHMIYLTSRPEETGFIDPRVEAIPVLEALEREAIGAIDIEFLRPATLENLSDRLACTGDYQGKPPVDILHFDGHGSFDADKKRGFLIFEDRGRKPHPVPAEEIGELLQKYAVGLMVLSACQSAQVAGEDPMGSVAVQLNAAGVPAVLAMSYSILVESARRLFGALYRNLLAGQGVGAALNGARVALFRDRARGERQRWQKRIVLELQDWFLPALYQVGSDAPLLLPRDAIDMAQSNEAATEPQVFVGRAWELWHIEREFVRCRRRITVSGFGGQGKTALAEEACRWLTRTGLFERSGFVGFAGFQNLGTADALRYAIAVLGQALGESFLDAGAVRSYLQNTPTLIVLDNLEALGDEGLTELLDAAVGWSEAGDSRVLLTTRSPRLPHAGYPIKERIHPHYAMRLEGWKEEDAITYFQQALKSLINHSIQLPKRENLSTIFRKVDFQPLSVRLLTELIKNQPFIELGKALDELLTKEDRTDPNHSLKASLNLSLQRLDPTLQDWLPRLGVFQGGAWEPMVQGITELTETNWQHLRHELETVGLIQVESLPGNEFPYLKFHPTLPSILWKNLDSANCTALIDRYQKYYFVLSELLYYKDIRKPVRIIALRELPNLLFAAQGALETDSREAVEFIDKVNLFLDCFGMWTARDDLTARATVLAGAVGSRSWFLARSNAAEQLYQTGHAHAAIALLTEILQGLATTPNHDHSLTLCRLGRCYLTMGRLGEAETFFREGLTVTESLIASDPKNQWHHQRQKSVLLGDLADVLSDGGNYMEARQAYEASLKLHLELGDERSVAVSNFQLGTLAFREGNLIKALEQYQRAIAAFNNLNEPRQVAGGYHQLGLTYSEAQQWETAEQAYRRASVIKESLGNLQFAAETWTELAFVCQIQGKLDVAENWYRKALNAYITSDDSLLTSKTLGNLAALLRRQRHRLAEAQKFAEDALTLKQTLDPAVTAIWEIYQVLAELSAMQSHATAAITYYRQMRQSYHAFPGIHDQLKPYADFIEQVVVATQNRETRQQLESELPDWELGGLQNFVAAIQRLLNGERDEDILCNSLNYTESAVICAILRDLGAPSSMPAADPLQQLLQSPAAQALIAQLAEVPEGQALLQAIKSGDEEALGQFLALLQGETLWQK